MTENLIKFKVILVMYLIFLVFASFSSITQFSKIHCVIYCMQRKCKHYIILYIFNMDSRKSSWCQE